MSHGPAFNDRRKSPRVAHIVPVKICSGDLDMVTETHNLSSSGAYCRVSKYLEPMTKLKIHLLLPVKKNNKLTTRKISCQGIVVRTEAVPQQDYFNVAIFFSDIQPKDILSLNDFVNGMMEQQAN